MSLANTFSLFTFTDSTYQQIECLIDESKQEGFELVQRTIAGKATRAS